MSTEIAGRLGPACATQLGRRRAQDAVSRTQPPGDQSRFLQFADTNRQVDPFLDQIDEAIRDSDINGDFGVSRDVVADRWTDVLDAEVTKPPSSNPLIAVFMTGEHAAIAVRPR